MKPSWACVFLGLALGVHALRHSSAGTAANPLLEVTELPRFADIDVSVHARPAVKTSLADGRKQLKAFEASLNSKLEEKEHELTFAEVATPLQDLYDVVGRPWGLLQHLSSVKESPALREALVELEPKVVEFQQELSQSRPIYQALLSFQKSKGFAKLPEARQRIVRNEVRDRKLSGVGLGKEDAAVFNNISQRLSKLSTEFSNHLLDATAAWNLTVHDKEQVRGIPARALALTAEKARSGGFPNATTENGPWTLSLDAPVVGPVMTYAEDRKLRETLFWASVTRASSGHNNNTPTIGEILENRQREARLLGYGSYANVSFASKMATFKEVHELMDGLQTAAKKPAEVDLAELKAFAKKTDNLTTVRHWDRGFYIERLRKEKFNYDSEALRDYFALSQVLSGLFSLSERLFGTKVTEVSAADAKQSLWDESVRLFEVTRNGTFAGYVFFDTYSRPGQKRAGAWAQPLLSRTWKSGGSLQHPVAIIVCNFPQPADKKPALLSFGEVETLFHEFGHALQHVLTTQDDSAVAGLNGVEWDAVEIVSQFMEYWVTDDKKTLYSIAKHHETGETLPESIYQNLKASQHFRTASMILGQVYLGSIDLRLHESFSKGEDIFAISRDVGSKILLEPALEEDRSLCAFSHIFAGGYAAGYYSYQWSKVLSADAFSAFEANAQNKTGSGDEVVLADETSLQAIGRRFAATLLALGGSQPPARVFEEFRGRRPSTDALLKYSGLGRSFAGPVEGLFF